MATEEKKKSTSKKQPEKVGAELYYFYSLGCAWCKKLEPIVDSLNNKGYNIIKLDTGEKDNMDAKKELQEKYSFKCGTPLLIDPKSGNKICGYRDEKTVEKLANGEDIPQPPRPKSPPPKPPKIDDEKDVTRWKKEYTKWRKDNPQVKTIPETEVMLNNLKRQFEMSKSQQQTQAATAAQGARLKDIEIKLDKLMNHLGVK